MSRFSAYIKFRVPALTIVLPRTSDSGFLVFGDPFAGFFVGVGSDERTAVFRKFVCSG